MSPILEINDVIIVKECDIEELKKDDIITFTKEEKTISHRIMEIEENENDIVFVTKGDQNEINDEGTVSREQIYGKYIGKISKIGGIVEYIQDKDGFIHITSLVIIIFILISMKDEKRNKRKMIRKKYEIKKQREKYN